MKKANPPSHTAHAYELRGLLVAVITFQKGVVFRVNVVDCSTSISNGDWLAAEHHLVFTLQLGGNRKYECLLVAKYPRIFIFGKLGNTY
jgi:hypothetical protein